MKIYFAGKFDLLPSGGLINDFRSILLGNSKKLTFADENVMLQNYPIIYSGPFYCEQASNGDYTSTDCFVVVTEETKSIRNADIFACVFDASFSVGSVVELIDAAHAKKRIAIFYKNESTSYSIKSEYWFAICRAIEICKANGTTIEVFSYDKNLLSVLYNWLTNLSYAKNAKKYVSTRESSLTAYLSKCSIVNTYTCSDKEVFQYEEHDSNQKFIVERCPNGLTMIKTTVSLKIKGLVDVSTNPLYSDENINHIKVSKAIIEGTDGVGKTSTIVELIKQGIVCFDRSDFICKYMLFDIPMDVRVSAYREYLNEISPYYVIFLTNNSRAELENRINSRTIISDFDKKAYEYNVLYVKTYEAMLEEHIDNPIELVDCTGLTVDEQVNKVKAFILRRTYNE